MTMFCFDAYEPPRAMASPASRVTWRRVMRSRWQPRARVVLGTRATDGTSRHRPSLEVRAVANGQVVLFLGEAGLSGGLSELGGGCVSTSSCALCWTNSRTRLEWPVKAGWNRGSDRSCTLACDRWHSGSYRILCDDTLPCSEFTTGLRFGGACPDCLEVWTEC